MAVHYTCRITVVQTTAGKLRLKYGPIDPTFWPRGETPVRVLTISGPAMVMPPDREFTAAELDRWEYELVAGTGFSFSYQITPSDAALVEARCTIEDVIPKGSVKWQILPVGDDTQVRTFGVELRNEWDQQIPKISLAICYEYETPQPQPDAPAQLDLQALGGSESFFQRMTPIGLDALPPHYPVGFFYPPELLAPVLSRAASLSPERYWIGLFTDGREFDRIPGSALSVALDALNN